MIGNILLALWLIITGVTVLTHAPMPPAVMAVLAIVAGILLLVGR